MSEPRKVAIALPAMGEEEWQALKEPVLSGWLTQGPKVAAFEKAFAARHQVPHALATTSCTTALHLALAGLGVGPGDEVIVPAFTWVATANAVVYCGARPVFADVDRVTFNLDPADVARKRTPRTKAVVAVHLFGLAADLEGVREAAGDLPIVEDAACAAGSGYHGRPVGGLGAAAAFSFHPRKAVTTGEGGMVTTRNAELAQRVNVMRNHGASVSEEQRHAGPHPYLLPEFDELGYNYRMTDLQAALGLVQLGKLDRFIEERRRGVALYERELAGVAWLRLPKTPTGHDHCWQSYVTYVDESRAPMPRNGIMDALQGKGIATRPGTHAVHMLGYYRRTLGSRPDDCPVARDCDRFSMAIPLHNRMSEDDFAYVVDAIRSLG